MLKIGVLGAGHLGKIHINCIKQLSVYELVGFYDQDAKTAEKVSLQCWSTCQRKLAYLSPLSENGISK